MSRRPSDIQCPVCNDRIEINGEACAACCPHDDTDEYCCLDCGKELGEDRAAAAYDRWKSSRQDD
jgi:DNA-directed RNA polymerase subunit RPC12/RpoP